MTTRAATALGGLYDLATALDPRTVLGHGGAERGPVARESPARGRAAPGNATRRSLLDRSRSGWPLTGQRRRTNGPMGSYACKDAATHACQSTPRWRSPWGSSVACGSAAALPAPVRNGPLSHAGGRGHLAEPVRPSGGRTRGQAVPAPGGFSRWVRYFWRAGWARSNSTAAAANAHGSGAGPLCVPEVPERF